MAQLLRGRGYEAYALLGGLGAWLDAGYPTDSKQAEQRRAVADICPDCGQPVPAHGNRPA